MNETITKAIQNELTLCYEAIGRKAPESAPFIAASIQEAVKFSNLQQVHECFKRAKDVESIPTQKSLKEAFKNYCEEILKYEREDNGSKAIEYHDRREAWLPSDDLKKRTNLNEAIKNYCVAIGGSMYLEYCKAHITNGDRDKPQYINADKALAFDRPVKKYLRYLYTKYWRQLPIANGYPAEAKLNLGLIPPTPNEFKTMLKAEGVIQ